MRNRDGNYDTLKLRREGYVMSMLVIYSLKFLNFINNLVV